MKIFLDVQMYAFHFGCHNLIISAHFWMCIRRIPRSILLTNRTNVFLDRGHFQWLAIGIEINSWSTCLLNYARFLLTFTLNVWPEMVKDLYFGIDRLYSDRLYSSQLPSSLCLSFPCRDSSSGETDLFASKALELNLRGLRKTRKPENFFFKQKTATEVKNCCN